MVNAILMVALIPQRHFTSIMGELRPVPGSEKRWTRSTRDVRRRASRVRVELPADFVTKLFYSLDCCKDFIIVGLI